MPSRAGLPATVPTSRWWRAAPSRSKPPPRRIRDETGRRAFTVAADIRKAHDCERIIAEPLAHFGRLDILVNNDGAPPLGELMSFDDAAWDKAWQQNFMSVVRLTRGAVPAMRAAGGGRIVNITALSVLQPMPKFGLSVATWAGVIGYAKTLSLEVAADNITVNTICPGRIATGRLAKVFGPGGVGAVEQDETIAKLQEGNPARPHRRAGRGRRACRVAGLRIRAATSPARHCMSTAAGGRTCYDGVGGHQVSLVPERARSRARHPRLSAAARLLPRRVPRLARRTARAAGTALPADHAARLGDPLLPAPLGRRRHAAGRHQGPRRPAEDSALHRRAHPQEHRGASAVRRFHGHRARRAGPDAAGACRPAAAPPACRGRCSMRRRTAR